MVFYCKNSRKTELLSVKTGIFYKIATCFNYLFKTLAIISPIFAGDSTT